eukprot:scaffold2353_cov134-Cylindrotheca_fusiformis.AAC.15
MDQESIKRDTKALPRIGHKTPLYLRRCRKNALEMMKLFSRQSKGALATVASAGGACTVAASVVPDSMKLTPTMKTYQWKGVPLVPIDFNVGIQELPTVMADDTIQKHTGPSGSIAFVVRRPG